jgi:hypothetical protein
LKLYHSRNSTYSRCVRILIAEKGLDIELAPVDLGAIEQFSDAYRAINSRAVVPTLVLALPVFGCAAKAVVARDSNGADTEITNFSAYILRFGRQASDILQKIDESV